MSRHYFWIWEEWSFSLFLLLHELSAYIEYSFSLYFQSFLIASVALLVLWSLELEKCAKSFSLFLLLQSRLWRREEEIEEEKPILSVFSYCFAHKISERQNEKEKGGRGWLGTCIHAWSSQFWCGVWYFQSFLIASLAKPFSILTLCTFGGHMVLSVFSYCFSQGFISIRCLGIPVKGIRTRELSVFSYCFPLPLWLWPVRSHPLSHYLSVFSYCFFVNRVRKRGNSLCVFIPLSVFSYCFIELVMKYDWSLHLPEHNLSVFSYCFSTEGSPVVVSVDWGIPLLSVFSYCFTCLKQDEE